MHIIILEMPPASAEPLLAAHMHFGLLNFGYLMKGEFYISHARPEKGTFSKPAGSHDLTNSQNPCLQSKGIRVLVTLLQ